MMEREDERVEPTKEGHHPHAGGAIGAELETALLHELQHLHREIDATFFKHKLDPAVIALSDASGFLGRWRPERRTIELSRRLVVEGSWGEVVEVMKHEMAHQYVDEVLHRTDETAHGPAFREICARIGMDARATASTGDGGLAAEQEQKVLQRVARLLALAERADIHEAQAAMSAAHKLMLKYNLDDIAAQARAPRRYAYRHLGQPTGRVSESEHILGAILAEHFFVEVIWVPVYRPREGKRGSVMEVCGTEANLEMAAYVHSFLTHTAEQLWCQHKAAHNIRSNRDRRTFLAGVMSGFRDKLRRERAAQQKEGLVWVRDADLAGYFRKRHPYIRHTRIQGNARTDAHLHGKQAGSKIELRRPMDEGVEGAIRLLPQRGGGA